jgi:phage shock protein C
MVLYCRNCGKSLTEGARFCAGCGTEVTANPGVYASAASRTLVRPRLGRMIGGVCQGLANQYNWDVVWIRVIAVVTAFFSGVGALVYIVLWIVTPEEPLALPPGQSFTPGS